MSQKQTASVGKGSNAPACGMIVCPNPTLTFFERVVVPTARFAYERFQDWWNMPPYI